MGAPLRVLIVEDSESDAALVIRQLRKAGGDVDALRVETAAEMRAALESRTWDVVIADYRLPQFDAPAALAALQETGIDLPFIVVSGTVGEDLAVAMMKAGAHDYLTKDKLARLAPAVERELRDAQSRRERRRAEDALRDSEERFRQVAEASGDFIWEVDAQGLYRYANPVVERMLGYTPDELVGKMHFYDLFASDVRDELKAAALGVFARKESFQVFPNQNVRKDGRVVILETSGLPILDKSGNLSGYRGVDTDITERKWAEGALRESEDHFRHTFEQAAVGMSILSPAGQWLRVNQRLCDILGYTHDELMKLDFRAVTHPEEIERDAERVRQMVAGTRDFDSWDKRYVRKDGQLIWARITTSLFRSQEGQPRYFIAVTEDITERRQAEERLRTSEARFRTVFEAVTDGILLADSESGRFVMANQAMCRMLGYTEEELLRLAVDNIHPPADLAMVKEAFQRQLAGERSLATGIPVKRKDGSTFIADIHGLPLTLGDTRCVLGVFRDMTAFNEMEQQLRQAQKMEAIGQLAGGVAHDFNNILCVIQGHCDLVLRSLREDDPLFRSVAQIQSSGERAAALTRQLLAFSRKQPLQPEVLDLNATVSNLESMLRRLIGEDIDLVTTLAADLGRVKADPGQVEQVIVNLAVNARDAMPRGGKLLIETANVELDEAYASTHAGVAAGPHVMLAITDTGCGMNEKTRERIFEPFFTTKEKGRGTGLGLSTVYGIVKQSGGSIWVYSEVGRGSTFKVYLPRTDEAVAMAAAGAAATSRQGAGERLLVVEDEPALREIVRDILTELGYRVTLAANGGDALLAVEEGRLEPDLLITDVVMPGMSGTVLAERLRRTCPALKVLFMSGYTDDGIVCHGAIEPGMPFIQKPFRIDDLATKVAQVLRGQRPSQ